MKMEKVALLAATILMLVLSVAVLLLSISITFAADAELASGTPRQKSLRHFYVTGSGNISTSASVSTHGTETWEIISISLNLSAAGAANTLTIIVNSGLGAVYDTEILSEDMTSVTDLVQTYVPGEMVLDNDDTLDFAWTNGSSRTYGLVVKYRLK